MLELSYDDIVRALPKTDLRPSASSPLKSQGVRAPTFVPPTLTATEPNALKSSVLVICAPAAVGKSMLASALAADAHLPILDLSLVPVATGSLRSCFTDLGPDGEVSFTSGKVAFLIDALDEGRLLSGEPGFRAFLESSAPLLAGAAGPRVVLLGRPESGDRAIEILRAVSPHISVARLELGFFDENNAKKLVTTYADQEAKDKPVDCTAYLKHRAASGEVVNAYFEAIARALGLTIETLWSDTSGKALAGYAPVLAALGTLLARLDNFQAVAQALQREGRQQAWVVIETVVRELLIRERSKQCKNLIDTFGDAIPKETFNENEQLALVAQYVVGRPRLGRGRLTFKDKAIQDAYATMVEQQLPEHPFVHDGRFRNQVFASIALAAEIRRGALTDEAGDELMLVSRQPFLWRSFLRSDAEGALIDGAFLGYLLDSFWSDPVRAKGTVTFKQKTDDYVDVNIPGSEHPVTVIGLPIVFFGQVVDIDVDMPSLEARFDGRSLKGQGSQFAFRNSKVTCGSVDFRTQNLVLAGTSWLSADTVVQTPTQIRLEPGAALGWGGAIGARRPFREHASTIQDPHRRVRARGLEALLSECVHRQVSPTIVVSTDYAIADRESGGPLTWMKAEHEPTLQVFLRLLVKHGAAKQTPLESRGAIRKITVHLNVPWTDLLDEYRRLISAPDAQTAHRDLLIAAMADLA
jgi:hypothetical protein